MRLRLIVADQSAVDDAALSALGARGIIRPSENAAQVVLGPVADLVAEEIRGALAGGGGAIALAPQANRGCEDAMLPGDIAGALGGRSEEHTSELQSLMRISYGVFCLKKKTGKANVY